MTPYPVFRPDGTALGYACGQCDRITTCSSVERLNAGMPGEPLAADGVAAKCCTCDVCGCPVPNPRSGSWCDVCYWFDCFARQWQAIGRAMILGITNVLVWDIVMEQYDYGEYMGQLCDAWDRGTVESPDVEESPP